MASGTTPVRGLPYPLESDVPDVAADAHALALALDHGTNSYQGSLAGRASVTPSAGDRYTVEGDSTVANNGTQYYWTGSAWVTLGQPSWTNLTPATGFTMSPGIVLAAARRVGDTVQLRGALLNTTGSSLAAGVTFATLPTLALPGGTLTFLAWVSSQTWAVPCSTGTTGSMTCTTAIAPGVTIGLDGVFFVR